MEQYSSLQEYFRKTKFDKIEAPCFSDQENIDHLTKQLGVIAFGCRDVIRQSADIMYGVLSVNEIRDDTPEFIPMTMSDGLLLTLDNFRIIIQGINTYNVVRVLGEPFIAYEIYYDPEKLSNDSAQVRATELVVAEFIRSCVHHYIPVCLGTPVGRKEYVSFNGKHFDQAIRHVFEATKVRFSSKIYFALYFAAFCKATFKLPIARYTKLLRIVYEELIKDGKFEDVRPYIEAILNPPVVDPQIDKEEPAIAETKDKKEDDSMNTLLAELKQHSREATQALLSSKCILVGRITHTGNIDIIRRNVSVITENTTDRIWDRINAANIPAGLKNRYYFQTTQTEGLLDKIMNYPTILVSDLVEYIASNVATFNFAIDIIEQIGYVMRECDIRNLYGQIRAMVDLLYTASQEEMHLLAKKAAERFFDIAVPNEDTVADMKDGVMLIDPQMFVSRIRNCALIPDDIRKIIDGLNMPIRILSIVGDKTLIKICKAINLTDQAFRDVKLRVHTSPAGQRYLSYSVPEYSSNIMNIPEVANAFADYMWTAWRVVVVPAASARNLRLDSCVNNKDIYSLVNKVIELKGGKCSPTVIGEFVVDIVDDVHNAFTKCILAGLPIQKKVTPDKGCTLRPKKYHKAYTLFENSPVVLLTDGNTGEIIEVLKDRFAKAGERRDIKREELEEFVEVVSHTAKEPDIASKPVEGVDISADTPSETGIFIVGDVDPRLIESFPTVFKIDEDYGTIRVVKNRLQKGSTPADAVAGILAHARKLGYPIIYGDQK